MSDQHPTGDMRYIELKDGCHVSRRLLCDHCGRTGVCGTERMMRKSLPAKTFKMCYYFIPVLKFRNPCGMDGKFNTIRLGMAWTKRVTRGTVVALMTTKFDVFGRAAVTSILSGTKEDMVERYAIDNHRLLVDGTQRSMEDILRGSYGRMIYDNNEFATVIYLRRE